MITIRKIKKENYETASALTLLPGQERFVQSAPHILASAERMADCRPVCFGIYAGERMVGLAMIHDLNEEPRCYHLARLMIDGQEQGKGYGTRAVELLLEHCKGEGRFETVELCVHREALAAVRVYEKAGFRDTGYTDPDTPECIIMGLSLSQVPLVIRYRDIVLRDRKESDIDDDIRWNTVQTEWALWDAPWEMEVELPKFDPDAYRGEQLRRLPLPKEEPRWGFELDTAEGVHIGSVNSYLIDENWEWLPGKDRKPEQKVCRTLGIETCDSGYWSRGLGTQALTALIRYYLEQGEKELCLQTWSGNTRMVRCAGRLGFEVCVRKSGIRQVRGEVYDGLTFKLNIHRFAAYLAQNP